MQKLYSVLDLARELNVSANAILKALRDTDVTLESGLIPGTAVSEIKSALGKEKSEPQKRPDEKPSRRHNPSEIHHYIIYAKLEEFTNLLEELGEDLSDMPRGHVFGGLATLLRKGIIKRWYENDTIDSIVGGFYPAEVDGNKIPDNVWVVQGAEIYRNWSDDDRQEIIELWKRDQDDLQFTYEMRKRNGDSIIAASAFAMAIEGKRFVNTQILEKLKWLSSGLMLYQGMTGDFKERIAGAFEDCHKRPLEFGYWLFSEEVFKQVQAGADKKVRDDNSYLAAVMFALKEAYPKFELDFGTQQAMERQYAAFRRMQVFREKGDVFSAALRRIKQDIDRSMKKNDKKIDTNAFIAETIKNKTYHFFYNNYCGRGIQYSTFITYSAAAFFLESGNNPEYRAYGEVLSKLVKERKVEKVDRLRGKKGKTILVDLCAESEDPESLRRRLESDWGRYSRQLYEEGCWLEKPRKEPFSSMEIRGMCDLVKRFPKLFNDQNRGQHTGSGHMPD